jgi:hypothetical protein
MVPMMTMWANCSVRMNGTQAAAEELARTAAELHVIVGAFRA